jgi:hypothetical protein
MNGVTRLMSELLTAPDCEGRPSRCVRRHAGSCVVV